MGFYNEFLVPGLVSCVCGTKPILKQREKIVPHALGAVLEIGFGSGHNLIHYDSHKVDSVVGIDPCLKSWELAASRVEKVNFSVDFIKGSAEKIPVGDACFDTVLMTYSLCTIPDPQKALLEAKRLLKPNGKLLFCEHGLAPHHVTHIWQNRINPIWRFFLGGCNLNRPILSLIEAAGFVLEYHEEMYLPNTPRIAGFNVWGAASHRFELTTSR